MHRTGLVKSPSLAQRKYLAALADKLGYPSGEAFMRDWTQTRYPEWTAKSVHLAIDECRRRLKPYAAGTARTPNLHPSRANQAQPSG